MNCTSDNNNAKVYAKWTAFFHKYYRNHVSKPMDTSDPYASKFFASVYHMATDNGSIIPVLNAAMTATLREAYPSITNVHVSYIQETIGDSMVDEAGGLTTRFNYDDLGIVDFYFDNRIHIEIDRDHTAPFERQTIVVNFFEDTLGEFIENHLEEVHGVIVKELNNRTSTTIYTHANDPVCKIYWALVDYINTMSLDRLPTFNVESIWTGKQENLIFTNLKRIRSAIDLDETYDPTKPSVLDTYINTILTAILAARLGPTTTITVKGDPDVVYIEGPNKKDCTMTKETVMPISTINEMDINMFSYHTYHMINDYIKKLEREFELITNQSRTSAIAVDIDTTKDTVDKEEITEDSPATNFEAYGKLVNAITQYIINNKVLNPSESQQAKLETLAKRSFEIGQLDVTKARLDELTPIIDAAFTAGLSFDQGSVNVQVVFIHDDNQVPIKYMELPSVRPYMDNTIRFRVVRDMQDFYADMDVDFSFYNCTLLDYLVENMQAIHDHIKIAMKKHDECIEAKQDIDKPIKITTYEDDPVYCAYHVFRSIIENHDDGEKLHDRDYTDSTNTTRNRVYDLLMRIRSNIGSVKDPMELAPAFAHLTAEVIRMSMDAEGNVSCIASNEEPYAILHFKNATTDNHLRITKHTMEEVLEHPELTGTYYVSVLQFIAALTVKLENIPDAPVEKQVEKKPVEEAKADSEETETPNVCFNSSIADKIHTLSEDCIYIDATNGTMYRWVDSNLVKQKPNVIERKAKQDDVIEMAKRSMDTLKKVFQKVCESDEWVIPSDSIDLPCKKFDTLIQSGEDDMQKYLPIFCKMIEQMLRMGHCYYNKTENCDVQVFPRVAVEPEDTCICCTLGYETKFINYRYLYTVIDDRAQAHAVDVIAKTITDLRYDIKIYLEEAYDNYIDDDDIADTGSEEEY